MTVRRLKAELGRELAGEFDLVVDPDHPFLFLGPDLLVSCTAGLAGLFVVHATEIRRPDDLLARMALARLAYPDDFHAALIIPPENGPANDEVFIDTMNRQFEAVFQWSNRRLLRRYLGQLHGDRIRVIPTETRIITFAQTEILYSKSLEEVGNNAERPAADGFHAIENSDLERSPVNQRPWVELLPPAMAAPPRPSQLRMFKDFYVGTARLTPPSSVQRHLTQVGRLFFEIDHTLDNGVPYRRRTSHNVLVVDRLPLHQTDPQKWLRASAFAGFSLIRLTEQERIEDKLHQLARKLGRIA